MQVNLADFYKTFLKSAVGIGISIQNSGYLQIHFLGYDGEEWLTLPNPLSTFWLEEFEAVWIDFKMWLYLNATPYEYGWKLVN